MLVNKEMAKISLIPEGLLVWEVYKLGMHIIRDICTIIKDMSGVLFRFIQGY